MSADKLFQRAGLATWNTLTPNELAEREDGWMMKNGVIGTSDSRVNGTRYSGALLWPGPPIWTEYVIIIIIILLLSLPTSISV